MFFLKEREGDFTSHIYFYFIGHYHNLPPKWLAQRGREIKRKMTAIRGSGTHPWWKQSLKPSPSQDNALN